MLKSIAGLWVCAALVGQAAGGEVSVAEIAGMQIYTAHQAATTIKFAPSAGANLYSIQVDGVEYLQQPESMDKLSGVGLGNPVLYPTPNRVKNAAFTFEGKIINFVPNSGTNFIHGLVNRHAWTVVGSSANATSASITCLADFRDGTQLGASFPFPHQLYLTVKVSDAAVRWTYEVDNGEGKVSVPFGFALHPYFVYQGQRDATYLKIPATHWMQASSQLPTGELISKDKLDYPLGEFMSLKGTSLDDVYWGIKPENPTVIEFRDVQRRVLIRASEQFTHLVVWTPDRPYFGVESQTCSTDAHNLHAAGKAEAAHLQICRPGQKMSGWVEYQFGDRK